MNKAAGIGVLAAMILFIWSSCAHAQFVIVTPGYDCTDRYNQIVEEEDFRLNECNRQYYYNAGANAQCQQIVEEQTNQQMMNDSVCYPWYSENLLIIIPGHGWHRHPVWHGHPEHHEPVRHEHPEHEEHEHHEHR